MSLSRKVVLILLAASLLAGAATGGELYYQLAYLWFFLYAGSWLLSRYSLRGLQLVRSSRTQRAQVGQVFEERFDLVNQGRFLRLWVEVRDESNLPGSEGSRILSLIEGKQGRSFLARTRLVRRGVFPLGPTVLAAGDIFGMFPVEKHFPVQETLLVYPLMVEIRDFPNPSGLLPGGESLRRKTHQVTPNASGVREYMHGDALNRIHWLSSARRDNLMVKEFELDPLADVWIFFDAYTYGHYSKPAVPESESTKVIDLFQRDVKIELPPESVEYGISSAASIARYSLRRGRAVGLVAAGKHLALLPPDRGGRQLGKILEALSLLEAKCNLPLRALVETQVKHITRGSTVVLVTPSGSRDMTILVDFLVQRGLRPVYVFIDPATFGGPKSDGLAQGMQLKSMGVPFRRIVCGTSLSISLLDG